MRYMRSSGCNRPSLISRRTRTNLPASSRPPGRSPNLELFRRQRMAHRGSGMHREGDLVAMKAQDERLFVLIDPVGKERPATDNTVEADVADLRQRCHLVPQKRGAPVDEVFREALTYFVCIDILCEAAGEFGECLAEGAAVALWRSE